MFRLSVGILVCASVALNVVLLDKLLSYHKTINRLRLDPIEKNLLPANIKKVEQKNENRLIIMFGDSRIANWRPMFEIPGWTIINKGVRGQTTSQLVLRLKSDVIDYSPDVVILQAGINDLKNIGLFPNLKKKIVKNCRNNLNEIIDRLAAESIQVIVLTIFPTGKPNFIRSWFWHVETNSEIAKINDTLKSTQRENISVIDSNSLLGKSNYIRPELEKDTVHLNRRGYAYLNEQLRPFLYNIINGK